jgi:hypothetical protein
MKVVEILNNTNLIQLALLMAKNCDHFLYNVVQSHEKTTW